LQEVLESLEPVVAARPILEKERILDRVVEPERMIVFRVPWEDDKVCDSRERGVPGGIQQRDRPLKGGLRFHPSVNQSILKFLGFEQIFKTALTTLPRAAARAARISTPRASPTAR
jgi:glutamate dehydrogenase (NADP+)